ncbi:putative glutamine amidotransferase [Pectobacterium atrosepticum SCRI1043]|uniref:Glutamine amidotransferase n=1 Tax=Pectobacterium atrosepticum (strain SCRI 1043 / ATCC BAA-672) TaxID=218491 RepID=Q6D2U0_PECAS|nr:glutamine amidotransferase [Pectobacterium atrosepticum]MCL6315020.1 glutamine amidotransferase [Pectobacterium atrosepticum]MCL6320744.1 glutamine amidotransferase [Pectobacterium atrosepticum]CAG75904.1 putative glutamine amidotransferase [Pectobacterium atrosepticum SCRI1043]
MSEKVLLVIQLGQPPEGIASQVGQQGKWFSDAVQDNSQPVQVVRPDLGEPLPPFDTLAAVIISGSWSMVTDRLEWSEYTAGWLREAYYADVPLLGVCYGHQLLADALGGKIGDNPNGKEVGVQVVTTHDAAAQDPLLRDYPSQFGAYLTHQQSVLEAPAGAQVLASSAMDGCQIIRYSEKVLTVQFHPEFNADIMLTCLRHTETALRQGGWDVDRMMDIQQEPVWARKILLDFVQRYAAK